MTQKQIPKHDPALINSSFVVFFLAATFIWAGVFSLYFPQVVQTRAFVLSSLFSIMLFALTFLVYQIYEGVTVLKIFLLYASLVAAMSFASAVKGPVADGQIPTIQFLFLGPYVYSEVVFSLFFASVFTFYGAVTFACSYISAKLAEVIYQGIGVKLIPKRVQSSLKNLDDKIDKSSTQKRFELFALSDWKGNALIVSILMTYTFVYFIALII